MDWKNYWEQHATHADALKQVARTGYPEERMKILMEQQAQHMAAQLELNGSQRLLDVCCGNGMFTSYLLPYCASTTGIDLATALISQARERAQPNQEFYVADALQLDRWEGYRANLESFDVITLCFSFQYFETVERGFLVISHLLSLLKPGGKILLTDVPDRSRFFRHYNSISRIAGLVVQMAKGNNEMGKFWAVEELDLICMRLEASGEKLLQPAHFPYAHYRMDYCITNT